MAKPAALRTSLIWHDEVMSDVVSERPCPITIGPFEGATFVTPDLGLPDGFAIVRPGSRGHVLTLGGEMRGTVCVGGIEHDVATLVKTSETPGFHATAIGGLDWGVIELDASGRLKLFFQFVGLDDVPVRPLFEQAPEQRASLVFSTVLHGALLFASYQLYVHHESTVDPTRDLTARYVSTRIETAPAIANPAAAAPSVTAKAVASPMPSSTWKIPDERPRLIATTVTKDPGTPRVFDDATQKLFQQITKHTGTGGLDLVTGGGPSGTPGVGPTTHGDGDGHGPGTHGTQVKGPGTLDTGGDRAPSLCVGNGCGGTPIALTPIGPTEDGPTSTLTEKDISDVIQHAKARLTSCYQREVNHDSTLAGTVQVRFEIAANGSVTSARVTSSTVRSEAVSECLTERISFLKFPAKGRAVVNYPFVFALK
ncbi:MAG: AgmX/PglI C-terminal domain-containing protein [Kofleriaceae bacterium]